MPIDISFFFCLFKISSLKKKIKAQKNKFESNMYISMGKQSRCKQSIEIRYSQVNYLGCVWVYSAWGPWSSLGRSSPSSHRDVGLTHGSQMRPTPLVRERTPPGRFNNFSNFWKLDCQTLHKSWNYGVLHKVNEITPTIFFYQDNSPL